MPTDKVIPRIPIPAAMRAVEPRTGAWFGFAAVAAWFVLYAVAALATPGYSILGNRLSDLGNPNAGAPWAFNAACVLAGLFLIPYVWALGIGLSWRMRLVGTWILTVDAAFLIGVGAFPEESPYNLHFIFSALFFVALMVAVSHYAVAMYRSPRYGEVSGILSVIASGLALLFVVAVLVELVGGAPIAGGSVSNFLEHATVFASLVWAAWNGTRLLATARGEDRAGG